VSNPSTNLHICCINVGVHVYSQYVAPCTHVHIHARKYTCVYRCVRYLCWPGIRRVPVATSQCITKRDGDTEGSLVSVRATYLVLPVTSAGVIPLCTTPRRCAASAELCRRRSTVLHRCKLGSLHMYLYRQRVQQTASSIPFY